MTESSVKLSAEMQICLIMLIERKTKMCEEDAGESFMCLSSFSQELSKVSGENSLNDSLVAVEELKNRI